MCPRKRYPWNETKCIHCATPFKSSRRDAKYCSARCRKVASRERKQRKDAIAVWLTLDRWDADTFLYVAYDSPGSLELLLELGQRLWLEQRLQLLSTFRILCKLPNDFTLPDGVRENYIDDLKLNV